MPYKLRRKGRHYQVVNSETGDVQAQSTSKSRAERQLKVLRGIEHGWEPEGDGHYSRVVNGRKVHLTVVGGNKRGSNR